MSDAPSAAVQNATPAPGSNTNPGGNSSPVNAASAASKANQQATAAGEVQGLTNKDQSAVVPDAAPTDTGTPATPEAVSLDAPSSPKPIASTGNEAIDQITSLLSNKGFDGVDAIIDEVIDQQALSLESKAKLVTELGADVAQLAINQLESSVAAVKEAGAKEGARLKEYAFKRIGGENADSTWAAIQQAVQSDTALTAGDRAAFNAMLNTGGPTAEIAIDSLVARYKDSGGTVAPTLMQGNVGTQDGFKPLGKREYQQEIGPLIHKYGESSQEVQALRNRRAISMSRGYN